MSAETVLIRLNGREVSAPVGQPLAQVLTAVDPALRFSPKDKAPRGMFCGMGLCFECMVEVDGLRRRSCLTPVSAGMVVRTGEGAA
ncbi:(2Fe-2S)-binding protein [Rhodobacter sp. SGA-6-6]|uniref:(2Fe-2S)-binding protein n=1 Tax=Rhodobacter sp. SGA-6-6 TaxID=2710882 RepID=UPI0013EB26FC|nr:(2Fe-2S)-binding protein [Rhodobacter sp. SGA-6-6]NGM44525.1 (2Fe-2S)-binding protein [Rhodobacter sp. SGA-6-6]